MWTCRAFDVFIVVVGLIAVSPSPASATNIDPNRMDWTAVWRSSPRAVSFEPDAAELVRAVRRTEKWLHDCNSFHIRARGMWTNTPEELAKRRAELREEYGVADPDVRQFPNAREQIETYLEIAVDRERVRYLTDDPGYWRSFTVWDGNELRSHSKYYHRAQEQYILENELPERTLAHMLPGRLGWPRSQPHSFWFHQQDVGKAMESFGRAEDFELVGRELYRGIPCYVLEYEVPAWHTTRRWYVGRLDGLLYGIQSLRFGKMDAENWWSDYREVVRGGWFPMRTGYASYRTDETERPYLASVRNTEVVEFRVNEPLADELFVLPLEPQVEPGVQVVDRRSGQQRVYRLVKPWPSLLGRGIEDFAGIELSAPPTGGKLLLIAFVDLEQRPSRGVLQQLAAHPEVSERGRAELVAIQASPMAPETLAGWCEKLSLEIGAITGDADEVRWSWGAKSLPWLILAAPDRLVKAEGFAVSELGAWMEKMAVRPPNALR